MKGKGEASYKVKFCKSMKMKEVLYVPGVTKRKFLWLGGTTTTNMTSEINISQYAGTISKSNTKGYRIVPYFKQLK